MLIEGLQRRCLGMPSWESYSMSVLIQHPVSMLSTTRNTLSLLLEMHTQRSFGLIPPAGLPHTAAPRRATLVIRMSDSATIST